MEMITKETARITVCKHMFCMNCIEMVIQTQHKCPLCRTDLPSIEKTLVEAAKETVEEVEDEYAIEKMGESSSKLDRLLEILESMFLHRPLLM
jgi:SWI/SNF-related matrix-associated actin-dependent regulator of chromatin subfamily A3